jgi:hypothetical protein
MTLLELLLFFNTFMFDLHRRFYYHVNEKTHLSLIVKTIYWSSFLFLVIKY